MNLVVQSPLKPGYSETFINAHLQHLPFNTFNVYSLPNRGYYPLYDGLDNKLFSTNIVFNYLEAGIDRLFAESGIGYCLRRKALVGFLRGQMIGAILAEYGPTGTYLMDICEQLDIPIIPYFHGRDAFHYDTLKRFGKKYVRLFRKAPYIFCVSKAMKIQLMKLGAPEDKIIINPCSPNTEVFTDQGLERRANSFLAVGRFCDKKAPLWTIQAFEKFLAVHADAHLDMVGDGPLWAACKSYIAEKGLQDSIKLLGRKLPQEVANLMNQTSIFLQHSIRAADGDSEGTPVSILEAMACGCPVVSTRHAGIPDTVEEGVHGYLVEEGDIDGMATQMLKLAELSDLSVWRSACQKNIQENYRLDQHIDKITAILNKVI